MAGGAEAGEEYLGDRHAGLDQLLARGRPAVEEPPVRAPRPADALTSTGWPPNEWEPSETIVPAARGSPLPLRTDP